MLGKCQTALRFAGDLLTGRQRKTHSTVHTKWYVSSTLLGKRAVKFLESANSQNVKFCYWNSLIFHLFGTFFMQKSAIFLNSIWTSNELNNPILKSHQSTNRNRNYKIPSIATRAIQNLLYLNFNFKTHLNLLSAYSITHAWIRVHLLLLCTWVCHERKHNKKAQLKTFFSK